MAHPEKLGKYPITAVLGEGAMGVVYKAFDPGIGRPVAIKTVRAELLHGDEGVIPDELPASQGGGLSGDTMAARFRNEARAAGRLLHPGIVAIYEYGEDAGVAFIAMEYVEGRTLGKLLAGGVMLPEAEILRVMDQLLEALDCAHQAGVWHRDIKPANLIVTASGRVKVTDFGIARIENAGLTLGEAQIGTPGYMAPEQYTGEGVDHRADLYAAGVLLYRMLTGRKPFEGAVASVMYKVMNEDPPPPSLVPQALAAGRPADYDSIIARALAREPAARFASAAEFRRALARRLQATTEPGSAITDMPTLLRRGGTGTGTGTAAGESTPSRATGSVSPPSQGSQLSKVSVAGSALASTGLAAQGWDNTRLAPVERALASVLGPMARLVLRQAARQTSDWNELIRLLGEQMVSEADRSQFLARLDAGSVKTTRSKADNTGAGTASSGAGAGDTAAAPAEALSEAQLAQAQQVLARHVGPIARLLVKKAAAGQPGLQVFAERLADLAELPNAEARARLLRELLPPAPR